MVFRSSYQDCSLFNLCIKKTAKNSFFSRALLSVLVGIARGSSWEAYYKYKMLKFC